VLVFLTESSLRVASSVMVLYVAHVEWFVVSCYACARRVFWASMEVVVGVEFVRARLMKVVIVRNCCEEVFFSFGGVFFCVLMGKCVYVARFFIL